MQRVEVIFLTFNNPLVESESLRLFITHTHYPYKLTVYDNRLNPPNMAKIWNKLIKESSCNYILIMDSDVFVETDGWLTYMMDVFKNFPADVVVPRLSKDSRGNLSKITQSKNRPHPFLARSVVSGCCFLFKKKLVELIGYFDEDFLFYGQDSLWFEMLRRRHKKIYVQPRAVIKHGYENTSAFGLTAQKAFKNGILDKERESEFAEKLFQLKSICL